MTDTFRNLCVELADELTQFNAWYIEDNGYGRPNLEALLCRCDAALAQSEPLAPTDEEIAQFVDTWWENMQGFAPHGDKTVYTVFEFVAREHFVDFARDALARWGTPAIQPVPVAERLPGLEDCDAEGGCWWWHPGHKEDDFIDGWILLNPKWAGSRRDSDDSLIYTHWLPHWALPVPTPAIAAELDAE